MLECSSCQSRFVGVYLLEMVSQDIWPCKKETLNWRQRRQQGSHPRKWFPQSERMCMPGRNEPQKGGNPEFSAVNARCGGLVAIKHRKMSLKVLHFPGCGHLITRTVLQIPACGGCHCTENAGKFRDLERLGRPIALKLRQSRGIVCLPFHLLAFKGLLWPHFQRNACLPLS